MITTFKFRLYPNAEQQLKLAKEFGAVRFVYNFFLSKRVDYYAATGKRLTYHDTALMLTQLRQQPEYCWLKDAHAQSLQQALRDLDINFNHFFNKRTQFPRFRKKYSGQTCRFPQNFKVDGNRLFVPKVGWIKVVLHRSIDGIMKNMTISKTKSGQYYASIQVEQNIPEPIYQGNQIGLNLGLSDFAVTSEGQQFSYPRRWGKSEKRLRRWQRRFAKTQTGSKGQEKARLKVFRQQEKIANQRRDFLHKLSRQLVEENRLIAIEDLHVKGMVKHHSLIKFVDKVNWAEFVRQLRYKGQRYGCEIGEVDRSFPSLNRCLSCGFVSGDLTNLNRPQWICPNCKVEVKRDVNAAQNILNWYTVGTTGIDAEGQAINSPG